MAIDYGLSIVGIAISDGVSGIAFPQEAIKYGGDDDLATQIAGIVGEREISTVVVGLPVHLSNESSEMSQRASDFAELLRKALDVPVELFDERLTTARAEAIMHDTGLAPSRNRKKLNSIAASVLLEDYLEKKRQASKPEG